MKGSEVFKEAIKDYLRGEAKKNPLFLKTLKKENKNINDCLTYIFNQVKASGLVGYHESEIYKMAVHYYDEDDIVVGQPVTDGEVVSNRAVQLTEEEIQAVKERAKEQLFQDELNARKKKVVKKPDLTEKVKEESTTLF